MTDGVLIHRIPASNAAEAVIDHWDMFQCGFRAARETDLRTVLGELKSGERTLWAILAIDVAAPLALFTTEIRGDDAGEPFVCVAALAGRDVRRWARALGDGMAAYAKEQGCRSVCFAGRRGWGRLLPDYRPAGAIGGETIWKRTV